MSALISAVRAFFYVGWVEQLSYPLALVDRVLAVAAVLTMLFFGGRFVDAGNVADLETSYFLWSVTGYAVLHIFNGTTTLFKTKVRHFQFHGVLEACAMTRTPFATFLVAAPAWDLASALLVGMTALVGANVLQGAWLDPARVGVAIAFLTVGTIGFVALGLLSAAASLAFKKGEPINRALSLATLLFAGAFYPREVLPASVQPVADWLPIAPVIDGMRASMYGDLSSASLLAPALRTVTIAVAASLAAAVAIRWAVRITQRDGSLGHY